MTQYAIPAYRPSVFESNILSWIRRGQGFIASYNAKTSTNGSLTECAFSLFNPSASGLSVLIYSIRINSQTSSASGNTVNVTTSDPYNTTGYTQLVTPVNQGVGTTSSVASCCGTANNATASVTTVGTTVDTFASNSNTSFELLTNGAVYHLPAGLAKGIAIFESASTAGNAYGATVRWIEYSLT